MQEDSLAKRYTSKLAANLTAIPIALVTQAVVPRGLGPAHYGTFTFLTSFFLEVINFFDAGTSIAFFTKLSRRLEEKQLVRFYWGFVGFVSIVVATVTGLMFALGLQTLIWPGQEVLFIWLSLVWALLTWYGLVVGKIVDAYGFTVKAEMIRVIQKAIGLSLILVLLVASQFNLWTFFASHFTALGFLILGWAALLRRRHIELIPSQPVGQILASRYIREFMNYSLPLLTYSSIGMMVALLDRWLLQKFAGSVQQGFYGLSYQIASISLVFTTAMTPLLTREFSIAHASHDPEKMRSLFKRYLPMLYAVSAFLGIFLAVQSSNIAFIFGGKDFHGASMAIGLMALYPIHQTYGQLSGSVFFATGQTSLYRNIGVTIMLSGIVFTIWLIGPPEVFGLNLGSSGLALKMIIVQLLAVNIQLWFNTKYLELSFSRFIWHQFYVALIFGTIAFTTSVLIDSLVSHGIVAFVISGSIYVIACLTTVFAAPEMVSMTRSELVQQLQKIKSVLLKR